MAYEVGRLTVMEKFRLFSLNNLQHRLSINEGEEVHLPSLSSPVP